MTIGFLAALLLAWPTGGLSILFWIVAVIGSAYFKAKARASYADEREVQRNMEVGATSQKPSWGHDPDEVDTFARVVLAKTVREGVPENFAKYVLAGDAFEVLLRLAGEMEARGNSMIGQQLAASNFIVEKFRQLSDIEKRKVAAALAHRSANDS